MKRFTAGFALLAVVSLAACAESPTSQETRTKNAALETTTSAAPIEGTTAVPVETSLPAATTTTGQPVAPAEATTTLPAPTTTAPTPTTTQLTTTTVNPLACLITAIRTGGGSAIIPMRVTACRPMKTLGISYWYRGNRITWYVTDYVPNSSTRDFDYFARIERVAGSGSALPDEVELRPTFTDGSQLPPVRLAISTTLQSTLVMPPAPTTTAPQPITTMPAPTTTVTLPKPTTTVPAATTLPVTTTKPLSPTTMPATTTTALAKPTSVNPLDCVITAIRTGGSGSTIPMRVTACRPMRYLNVSYWLGGTRLTYVVTLPVSNATTSEFDWFSKLSRYLGKPDDLPDSISLTPQFSDGSSMAAVRLPISTTLQSTTVFINPPTTTTTTTPPPTTTTTRPPTTTTTPTSCTITLKGSILRACRAISYLDIEWWTDTAKINVSSRGTKNPAVGYIEIVPAWSTVKPTRGYVKLRLDDGSELEQFFVPISMTANLKFDVAFTKPPSTTLAPPPPPTTTTTGCDLRVRYGAISSTCGTIYGYSYRWHDGTKPISGKM
ncbi:MAG: hypothetical protein ACKOA5_11565, partial [Actinomycetota bacterium]